MKKGQMFILAIAMACVSANAQNAMGVAATTLLSDGEAKAAVSGVGKNHFVVIEDMGLMAAQGNQVPSITLYMPEAILAIKNELAKQQFTEYAPTEEDKQRSLTVIAKGYAGKTINEGCASITRILLLSDQTGSAKSEAYVSEPVAETWRNGYGATNHCQSLRAKFALEEVERVKAAAPKGEFLVAVFAGSVNTKMYKVKARHQSKLGLQ